MSNYVGVAAVLDLVVEDVTGAVSNVDTLTAYLRDPSNVETVYVQGVSGTWTNLSTGVYTFSFTPDRPGNWKVGFTGVSSDFAFVGTVAVNVTTLRPFD